MTDRPTGKSTNSRQASPSIAGTAAGRNIIDADRICKLCEGRAEVVGNDAKWVIEIKTVKSWISRLMWTGTGGVSIIGFKD